MWAQLLQSCPTLLDPVSCSPPGSSIHGILWARLLEWVAMPSSRGSSQHQESDPCLLWLLHWQADSLPLSHGESPRLRRVKMQSLRTCSPCTCCHVLLPCSAVQRMPELRPPLNSAWVPLAGWLRVRLWTPPQVNCLTSFLGSLEGPHRRIGRVTLCRRFASYKGHPGVLHHANTSLQAFDKPQMWGPPPPQTTQPQTLCVNP